MIPMLLLGLSFSSLQQFTITGRITDEAGNSVPFATITISETRTAVTADARGMYSITATSKNVMLVVTAVGHTTATVKTNGKSVINITLTGNPAELSSVIVTTGYGVRKVKRSVVPNPAPLYERRTTGKRMPSQKNLDFNTEDYDAIVENSFHKASDDPLSTFSIDVDAACYSNIRRFINDGALPPTGAVRIEEMINYFRYSYPQPADQHPFSITTELSACPWNNKHKLALIGLQGKQISTENLPASNLIFLIDVSGSMSDENKLPLVQSSLKLLTEQLREKDRLSIVVYAGDAGLVLPATNGSNKIQIRQAIDELHADGSTAGGEGIKLAYETARQNFIKDGNNRVILCTDGDFNVGTSSDDELERLIEKERESGVYLTVLGYGMGNYKDNKMQKLADKGNGNHAYIDGINEAKKVLVNEFGGTLFTIAKDVKLQIEFNPAAVAGYRLIGYENRLLSKEDFNDDKKRCR